MRHSFALKTVSFNSAEPGLHLSGGLAWFNPVITQGSLKQDLGSISIHLTCSLRVDVMAIVNTFYSCSVTLLYKARGVL